MGISVQTPGPSEEVSDALDLKGPVPLELDPVISPVYVLSRTRLNPAVGSHTLAQSAVQRSQIQLQNPTTSQVDLILTRFQVRRLNTTGNLEMRMGTLPLAGSAGSPNWGWADRRLAGKPAGRPFGIVTPAAAGAELVAVFSQVGVAREDVEIILPPGSFINFTPDIVNEGINAVLWWSEVERKQRGAPS